MKKKVDEELNLWNVIDKKHKKVLCYINCLYPKSFWGLTAKKHFSETIKLALNAKTSNEALTIIGYKFKQKPQFFEECQIKTCKKVKTKFMGGF